MLRALPTYQLPGFEPAADEPAQTSPIDDRPAWASALPTHRTLVYVRDLATAALASLLVLYLLAVATRDPSALVRALRARAGV